MVEVIEIGFYQYLVILDTGHYFIHNETHFRDKYQIKKIMEENVKKYNDYRTMANLLLMIQYTNKN